MFASSPHTFYAMLKSKSKILCMLGKHSQSVVAALAYKPTNWQLKTQRLPKVQGKL